MTPPHKVLISNAVEFCYLHLMMDWFANPHAGYVFVAYGIALVALTGFALLSWHWARTQNRKWRQSQQDRTESSS